MKRTITTEGTDLPVLTTTNGVSTQTTPFYLRSLKDYTPLPNGFNLELATEILDTLTRTQGALWDQGSWRTIFEREDMTDRQLEAVGLLNPALLQDTDDRTRCGSAMCQAGWAAELTGADWALDAVGARKRVQISDEAVMVTKAFAREHDLPVIDSIFNDAASRAYLASRGFHQQTHTSVSVSTYGMIALGIGDDRLDLFSGDNHWWDVRGRMDAYTLYGPDQEWSPEIVVCAFGRASALEEHEYSIEDVDAAEAAIPAGMGWEYHRENAPDWALEAAGELVG